MSMGTWKTKLLKKKQRGSQTKASGFARIYFAYPPIGGWPGGLPEHNGWRKK